MQNTLLIDGNAVAYTVKVVDSQYVGDRKSFCRQYLAKIREYAKQIGAVNTKAILFFDDKAENWREQLFPDYQKQRKATHAQDTSYEAELRKQYWNYLKQKFAESKKYTVVSYPHTETDDLIAIYCKCIQQEGEIVTIATTDKDLYQLISEDVHKPVRVLSLITRKIVKAEKDGKTAMERKIWLGDNSDSIPGVCKNVGEKSIDDFKTFLAAMKEQGTDPTDKVEAKRVSESLGIKYVPSFSNYDKDQHELNRKLIDLNYVVEFDHENDDEKLHFMQNIVEKAKFLPGSIFSLSSFT